MTYRAASASDDYAGSKEVETVLSTRIKDAGIAIRHLQGHTISILQGLEMGWKGLAVVDTHTQKEVVPK